MCHRTISHCQNKTFTVFELSKTAAGVSDERPKEGTAGVKRPRCPLKYTQNVAMRLSLGWWAVISA